MWMWTFKINLLLLIEKNFTVAWWELRDGDNHNTNRKVSKRAHEFCAQFLCLSASHFYPTLKIWLRKRRGQKEELINEQNVRWSLCRRHKAAAISYSGRARAHRQIIQTAGADNSAVNTVARISISRIDPPAAWDRALAVHCNTSAKRTPFDWKCNPKCTGIKNSPCLTHTPRKSRDIPRRGCSICNNSVSIWYCPYNLTKFKNLQYLFYYFVPALLQHW